MVFDMVFREELVTKHLDFIILQLFRAAVQSYQKPGQFDVKVELLSILDIILHNFGEVGSSWADLCFWPLWCFSQDLIGGSLLARTGCVLFMLKKTKITPELMLVNKNCKNTTIKLLSIENNEKYSRKNGQK